MQATTFGLAASGPARGHSGSGELVELLSSELELGACREDLGPGDVVHRNAVALALRAGFPFRLAGDAHLVEAGSDRRLAQRFEESSGLGGERVARAEALRIDKDRQHAVPDALFRAVVRMPGA